MTADQRGVVGAAQAGVSGSGLGFQSFRMNKLRQIIRLTFALGCLGLGADPSARSAENKAFQMEAKGMRLEFDFFKGKFLRLKNMLPVEVSQKGFYPPSDLEYGNLVLFQVTGESQQEHHGPKFVGGEPGMRLEYLEKQEMQIPHGREVVIVQRDPKWELRVESIFEINDFSPVVRCYTRIRNDGTSTVGIDYLSSATLYNFGNLTEGSPQDNLRFSYAYNSWKQEAQWKTATLPELGWCDDGGFNLNGIFLDNVGSWSTVRYLPLGILQNRQAGVTWFWQIEHNGSWHAEFSNASNGGTYLYLGGPDALHGDAWKSLKPGESYVTVPVALGCVRGGFDEAVAALTSYRRNILLRKDSFTSACPVVFNDYMNCLKADPTTEKELPLISAAAKAGCDYYVIDAGWYAEINENWWDSVGAWEPSKTRFTGGLQSLIQAIKAKGMIPGIWLEPEVIGVNSPLRTKPDDWFLQEHGKRIIDNGRFLLDFRTPEVRNYMHSVVNRLIQDYGVGYLKLDYNNSAPGTDLHAESAGQGLLEHNRAVAAWVKELRDRHPAVVIENCGSGGCRMDYAMLSQAQIQSSSDQEDYKKYPAILVGELAAVLPEQLGIWSYPFPSGDAREASFNMVSAMAGRICQSGYLSRLKDDTFQQVEKGIHLYKETLAPAISDSIPYFPLGLPSLADKRSPIAVGLRANAKDFVFIWRLEGESVVDVPEVKPGHARLLYPESLEISATMTGDKLEVAFPAPYMAAVIELTHGDTGPGVKEQQTAKKLAQQTSAPLTGKK